MTIKKNARARERLHSFESPGGTVAVSRVGMVWTLTVEDRVVETRDLSAGVDELLGHSTRDANLASVLRIMEADAKDAR